MYRIPKLVASRTLSDLNLWENSSPAIDDLIEVVSEQKTERDFIIAGRAGTVHTLAEQDLVDEYRILVFPELIARGTRLFTPQTVPARLRLVSSETVGPAILARYERAAV